jgi:hypothetical protein
MVREISMKRFLILAVLLVGVLVASAEDAPPPSQWDDFKKYFNDRVPHLPDMPSVQLPSVPDFSILDFSRLSRGITGEFNASVQQVGDSLPLLEEMGYEVSTFRSSRDCRQRPNSACEPRARLTRPSDEPISQYGVTMCRWRRSGVFNDG